MFIKIYIYTVIFIHTRFFDNPVSKCLIFKPISCMQLLFGLFSKIKKGPWTGFLHDFSTKMFLT